MDAEMGFEKVCDVRKMVNSTRIVLSIIDITTRWRNKYEGRIIVRSCPGRRNRVFDVSYTF